MSKSANHSLIVKDKYYGNVDAVRFAYQLQYPTSSMSSRDKITEHME